ncbi:hypothetical protein [Streptomyces sp. NPDC087300]|uniref:hypothetical protein n=1 Tax=Streptomyces sp. NPDC087300 TaxID=3365780 RepID=UPI003829F684
MTSAVEPRETTTKTEYEFTGLTPGTRYTVSVRGRKGVEAGPAATEETQTKTKLPTPAPPVLKSGTRPTETGFELQWKRDPNASAYKGTATKVGGGGTATVTVDSPLADPVTAKVTGAVAATEYEVTIVAVGDESHQDSDASAAARFRTASPATPVSPPGKPTVKGSPTADGFVVEFTASSTAGATYTATAKKSDDTGSPVTGTVETSGAKPTATFTGLTAETAYKATVIAKKSGSPDSTPAVSEDITTAASVRAK